MQHCGADLAKPLSDSALRPVCVPACPPYCALCSGVGALFNIICLALCFIFPAKNRASSKTDTESGGFFRRFSSRKNNQAALERDTDAAGSDVSKGDMESATNIVADSSRL